MVRNRILYFTILFLAFCFIYFYGGKMPYMLFYMVLLLPAFSLLHLLVAFPAIKYEEIFEKEMVTKGENVNYKIILNYQSPFFCPYVRLVFDDAGGVFTKQFPAMNLSLLPFTKTSFNYIIECKYRGDFLLGLDQIEVQDFLGLFRFKRSFKKRTHLTICPRILLLEQLHLKQDLLEENESSVNNRFEDMTIVSDMRKYKYGDSYKKIHWKLTARSNELIVKNYQSAPETSVILALDLKKLDMPLDQAIILEDRIIETFVSVVYHCLSKGIRVNVVYCSESMVTIPAENLQDFYSIYKMLASVHFLNTVEIGDVLDIFTKDNITSSNMMVFSANLDYNLYNEMYKLVYAGYDASLVYISTETDAGAVTSEVSDILSALGDIGTKVYRIASDTDIISVFA